MAQRTLTRLPGWIAAILKVWGQNVDDALAEFNELAALIDAPEEWRNAVNEWAHSLALNVQDPGAAQALILSIYLELTSDAPGWNADAGGLA